MAIQISVIKIKGKLGDLSFYKSGDQYIVRRRGGFSAERIAKDPKCARIREQAKEFGGASKAAKLLRVSLRSMVQHASDKDMFKRLVPEMFKVVKSDTTSVRGDRTVFNGRPELLQGFEFNNNQKLSMTLHAPYKYDINRKTGVISISIPPFIPANMITAPDNTTYFTITGGAAAVDFQAGKFVADTKKTEQLSFNSLPTEEIKMELVIKPASTLPLFVVLGIEFYQEVDGSMEMVDRGVYNSLALILVQGERSRLKE